MTLLEEIDNIWQEEKDVFARKLNNWIGYCNRRMDKIKKARARFYQRVPLRAYISLSECGKKDFKFSIRFLGQKVANIAVKDKVMLEITEEHYKNNKRDYDLDIEKGENEWNSKVAKIFSSHFIKMNKIKLQPKAARREHYFESELIHKMIEKGHKKVDGIMRNIKPVVICGLPLQIPLPISGCSGNPIASNGHIDILSRRKGKLSVWEIKRPGVYKSSLRQAYIYAVTLLRVLRGERGDEWYKLFGFSQKTPSNLVIEAVAVLSISEGQKKNFIKELSKYKDEMPLQIGRDSVKLCVAYYDKDSCSVKSYVNHETYNPSRNTSNRRVVR